MRDQLRRNWLAAMQKRSTMVTSRQCGECFVCCVLTTVPELSKPTGTVCQHCDHGCKIYPERPVSCQLFACGWLRGDLPEWARPDEVHVMIEPLSDHFMLAVPEPGHERTWRTNEMTELLVETYQKRGIAVMSLPDTRALIPDGHSADEVAAALQFFAQYQADRARQ